MAKTKKGQVSIETARADAKLSLGELFEKTSGYPLSMPVTIKPYLVRYQKAYHRRYGERINRDKLVAKLLQRSLMYLVVQSETLERETKINEKASSN